MATALTPELSTLARPRLERLIARAEREASEICSAFIAAGRGGERPTEIRKMDDELARRYCANSDTLRALRDEADYRRRYHGSLLPVKRSAW